MYYEINVAFKGRHFFATADRSITDRKTAEDTYRIFQKKFPASEGYEISVRRWELVGTPITFS